MHQNLLILSFITNYFSFENITPFVSKISDRPKIKTFLTINKTLIFYDKTIYSDTYSTTLSLLPYIPSLQGLYSPRSFSLAK